MRLIFLGFFLGILFLFFAQEARSQSGKRVKGKNIDSFQNNGTKLQTKQTRSKSKHHKVKMLEPVSLKSRNKTEASLKVKTSNKTVHRLPLSQKGKKEQKRQFILRPPHLSMFTPFQKSPFMMMRPPPLTQKTVVTTHIPRPPIAIPYNSLLMNHLLHPLMGEQQGMRSPFQMLENPNLMKEFEEDEDEDSSCDANPCQNGGTCNEVKNGYECICSHGFKGSDCEEENKCHPNPCRNGGICTMANGGYVCTCMQGYKGSNCEEHNKCQPNPCRNGGSCTEVDDGFECACPAEYKGQSCEAAFRCAARCLCLKYPDTNRCACSVVQNRCYISPCLNGGTCLSSSLSSFSCLCADGFSGQSCEVESKCRNLPCRNGGTCFDHHNSYTCACTNGFSGVNCETMMSACDSNPCLNSGSCINQGPNIYKCICQHGFKGKNCEMEKRCEPNPCQNSGICRELLEEEEYRCECQRGFRGKDCEEQIDFCESSPCANGATCSMFANTFHCLCANGYKGLYCRDVERCHPNPCRNGGTCISELNGYRCECREGYRGNDCEEELKCHSNPCQNGGTCYENSGGYTCTCMDGYKGVNCAERDRCHPSPCRHGGLCEVENEDAVCTCLSGFTGPTCEEEDRCHPNPCSHGGVCITKAYRYECHCPVHWSGMNCEVPSATFAAPLRETASVVNACATTTYGCCPDGTTVASGPHQAGCPEHIPGIGKRATIEKHEKTSPKHHKH